MADIVMAHLVEVCFLLKKKKEFLSIYIGRLIFLSHHLWHIKKYSKRKLGKIQSQYLDEGVLGRVVLEQFDMDFCAKNT